LFKIIKSNIYKSSKKKKIMGMNIIELSITPESIDTDLESIKQEIKKNLKKAKNVQIEEKEIAFGLKALRILVALPDNEETDEVENIISGIKGVSSCKIEDIRRAFG